jgi:membrane protease YdiL (CAAX protease family)
MNTQIKKTSTIKKGWLRVLLLIIPYFIITGIFQFLGAYLVGADVMKPPEEQNFSASQNLGIAFFLFLGTFLIIGVFRKYIDRASFVSLGFAIKNRAKDIGVGLGLGFLVMSLGLGILVCLKEIEITAVTFNGLDFFYCILLFVFVSINEEILIRGYVLNNLMFSFNKYIALVVSALLFALMHTLNPSIDWFGISVIFLAGILLGATYIYTKNLWFPIALHFSWNFFQSIYGFKVSGQSTYALFNLEIAQNNRWNGGDFGFEGSYLSLIGIVLLIIGLNYYYSKKEITNE